MKDIAKRYSPKDYEEKWASYWLENKSFSSSPNEKEAYSIVIPPPNVTGVLHMGHALNNVLQDIVIRYNKIKGKNPMWMPGTDHGGIATQNVVEKMLYNEDKKTRHDLGREAFLERMWRWKEESGGTIISQLKRIGCGCDWDRLRFTMDDKCGKAVREAFKHLADKKLIYRGRRMTNWCIRCQTALSDIEVENEEKSGHLWYIRYYFVDEPSKYLVVATTRPETMLGDTAVAVNPKDERFKDIIGKRLKLPLTDRDIPVIADAFVDMEFGTGCVKVTPEHDPNDDEMGQRHNLEKTVGRFVVISREGKMTADTGKYADLSREECRKQVIKDLGEKFIEKIEDYCHAPGTCYRCSTIIEPLKTRQWFLKMQDIAQAAADATRDGRVKFQPESWSKPYLNWLDNIRDWCLSRQIWWGHRIPIWYCGKCDGDKILIFFNEEFTIKNFFEEFSYKPTGNSYTELRRYLSHEDIINNADAIYIPEDVSPIIENEKPGSCPNCKHDEMIQDPDVLDTWFSSALWPFSTLGWPDKNEDLEYYYPTDVLVTGHEILYLWVARMVMMGLELMGEIPFHNVNIHGIIRDEHGNKMSKSKGNVIDPLGIIDEYGTDSLRFALAKSAVLGRDMQLSDDDFIGARNFCNKIWNAARFILSSSTATDVSLPEDTQLELADKWILNELQKTTDEVNKAYQEFNTAHASRVLYEYVWNYFCDWYLELAKIRLYSDAPADQKNVSQVLVYVLVRILSLINPIMPFISSQLWEYISEEIAMNDSNIMDYNSFDIQKISPAESDIKDMQQIMDVISGLRNIRGENNLPPSLKLKVRIRASERAEQLLSDYADYIKVLSGLESIEVSSDFDRSEGDAVAAVGTISLFVALPKELKEQELARLEKKISELKDLADGANKKLRNRDFMSRAPEHIVSQAKERAEKYKEELLRLEKNHLEIKG